MPHEVLMKRNREAERQEGHRDQLVVWQDAGVKKLTNTVLSRFDGGDAAIEANWRTQQSFARFTE